MYTYIHVCTLQWDGGGEEAEVDMEKIEEAGEKIDEKVDEEAEVRHVSLQIFVYFYKWSPPQILIIFHLHEDLYSS